MAAGFQDLAPPKADRDPVQDALAKERALKAEGLGGYAPQPQAAVDPLKAKEAKARIAKLEAETARIQQGRPDPSFDDRIALVEKKMAAAKDTWDMEGIAAAEAEWRQILREKAGAGSPAAPAEDPIDAELRRRGAAPR